jgi:hypothetical protein
MVQSSDTNYDIPTYDWIENTETHSDAIELGTGNEGMREYGM